MKKASEVRQIDVNAAELLELDANPSGLEIAISKLQNIYWEIVIKFW
jgi:hypothetical protein